jgi:hypothetical protein
MVHRTPSIFALVAVVGCGDGVGILLGEVAPPVQPPSGGVPDPLAGADAQVPADASSEDSNPSVGNAVADAGPDSAPIVDESGTDSGVFGPPVLVSQLVASGYTSYKETLTADMLEMYFISDRPGGPGNQDVWHATRGQATDPWGPPSCVLEVSSPSHETGPAVAPDGLTLWISSDRAGGKGGYDIWVSTRADSSAVWSTPKPVAELNTPGDEYPRPPIQSGLVMPPAYREKLPNNQFQTFLTSRSSADMPWTPPSELTEVDTADIDTDGFLTDDQLTLYFSSDRTVVGDQDLYIARRSSPQSPFASFTPISELNTTFQERDPWVSRDGHQIYFSSDRDGSLQIYQATR